MRKRDKLKNLDEVNKKLEESYLKSKGLLKEDTETVESPYKPMIRHLAGQGLQYSQQSDKMEVGDCDKCGYYLSKRHNHCGKCGKCLLSKKETEAKLLLARGNQEEIFKLKNCLKKHNIEI